MRGKITSIENICNSEFGCRMIWQALNHTEFERNVHLYTFSYARRRFSKAIYKKFGDDVDVLLFELQLTINIVLFRNLKQTDPH